MNSRLHDKVGNRLDHLLDEASAFSFPASDPPFFMGSTAIAGARHASEEEPGGGQDADREEDEREKPPARRRRPRTH
jgi:hypothetical protein